MSECKRIKNRDCKPAECLLQAATAAATNFELHENKQLKGMDPSIEDDVWTTIIIAEKLRECALDTLANENEWIKQERQESERVRKEMTPEPVFKR